MKLSVYQLPSLSAEDLPVLNNILSRIIHAINNIDFGDGQSQENVWCTFVVVDGPGANVVASAAHSLKRKPIGTIVVWADKATSLYKPTATASADTDTAVYYKFDTASVSAVLLLI